MMTTNHKTLSTYLTKGLQFLTLFVAITTLSGCQGVEETKPDCTKEPTAEGCKALETPKFPAPTNLEAEVLDQTSIRLTWNKPDTTKTFQTEIQMKIGSSNFAIVKKVDGDVETFDVNHLTADTSYTFRIKAIGDAESEYTSEVTESSMTATINPLFPKPTLTATAGGGNVVLSKSWSNTSSVYVAGIEYEIMAEGNFSWSLLGAGSFGSSFTHTFTPAGILQYKIKVIYTDGTIFADEAGLVMTKLLAPIEVDGEEVDIFGIAKHKVTWDYGTSPGYHSGYRLLVEYINTSSTAVTTSVTLANITVKTHTMIPTCQSGTPVKYRVVATSNNAAVLESDASSPEFVITCP